MEASNKEEKEGRAKVMMAATGGRKIKEGWVGGVFALFALLI